MIPSTRLSVSSPTTASAPALADPCGLTPDSRTILVSRKVPGWRALHARDCVAKLRAAYARNVDDPWFNELVALLRARSREFAGWWNQHDVQLLQDGMKCYDHPEMGRLSFDYTVLDLADERSASLHLVTYLPVPETDTRAKMERLLVAAVAETPGLATAV